MEIPTLPPMTFPTLPPVQPLVPLNSCGLPACGLGGQAAPNYYLASDGKYYVQPNTAATAGGGAAAPAGGAAAAEVNEF